MDWTPGPRSEELRRFTIACIALRAAHPVLRRPAFPTGTVTTASAGFPDVSWHGTAAWQPDWSADSRLLAVMHSGPPAPGTDHADVVYVAFNTQWADCTVTVPAPADGLRWTVTIDTAADPPADRRARPLSGDGHLTLPARSAVVLVAGPAEPGGPPPRPTPARPEEAVMSFISTVRQEGSAAVITLAGSLDSASAPFFRESISDAVAISPDRLVLDVNDLEYISSAGLRGLVTARQRMRPAARIILVGTTAQVASTLRMTGFHHSVYFADTLPEALDDGPRTG
ncbi:MAG: anti-sigma factor antagonist [Kineosporiaceae bacterium]